MKSLTTRLLLALGVAVIAGPARAAVVTVAGTDSAAIAAAVARSQPGDTVKLPAGTYTIAEAVRPKSRTRLQGEGADKTILRFAAQKPGVLIDLSGCEDVEVCALALDGAENPNATQGLFAHNARRLQVHHLTIRNLVKGPSFGPHGIYFSGTNPTKEKGVTDSEIADCLIENIGIGASYGGGIRLAWGSARNRVLRNTIRDTGRGGIFGDKGATDLVVRENIVTGSRGEGLGIEMWGGCHRAVVEDNRIDHWLSFDSSDYSAARRNVISDRSGEYKALGLELVASNYCVFTDNKVEDGQRIGISVSNKPAKNWIYWGYNTIRGCNHWGAQLQGESGGLAYHYFYRCEFLDTPVGRGKVLYPGAEGHGFRTNGNAKHITLEECLIQGNGRSALQLGGPDVDGLSFVRCTLRENRGPVAIGPNAYTALEWTDCIVEKNGSGTLPAAKPYPHPAPVASFGAPATARAGQPVRFASTSRAADGKIAQVLWDFNDGIPATDAETTHTYAKPGEYRVTLLVWDEHGRGARAEKVVRVEP